MATVVCLVYVVWHNHELPDAGKVVGLSGFGTAHYLMNRASTVTDNALKGSNVSLSNS